MNTLGRKKTCLVKQILMAAMQPSIVKTINKGQNKWLFNVTPTPRSKENKIEGDTFGIFFFKLLMNECVYRGYIIKKN
jgi:hypothetical protein